MSGFNVYPQPVTASRLVLKQNTPGQILLPSLGSAVSASTDSVNESFGAWTQVTASTAAEYYITQVVAYNGSLASTAGIQAPVYVDIGRGGSGSEVSQGVVPVAKSIPLFGGSPTNVIPGGGERVDPMIRVAAGQRLSVRVALAVPATSTRTIKVYLVVVPISAVEGN